MKPLSKAHGPAQERRARFYELRREGLSPLDISAAMGISWATASRYEHWFQVIERGEQIIPGKRWPASER